MQEGHLEAASPLSLSLCLASCVGNERTNATMWHKVSLFPQLPNKTCGVAIKEWESETESNRGNEIEGNVYLSRLNGQGISVHESGAARLLFGGCAHTHTHTSRIYHQCLSMWLIHCAASVHFVVPRCCHDQDLQLLKLILADTI